MGMHWSLVAVQQGVRFELRLMIQMRSVPDGLYGPAPVLLARTRVVPVPPRGFPCGCLVLPLRWCPARASWCFFRKVTIGSLTVSRTWVGTPTRRGHQRFGAWCRAARLLLKDNLPGRSCDDALNLPAGSDTAFLQALGVSCEAGRYVFEGLPDDCLANAVVYTRLRHLRQTRHEPPIARKPPQDCVSPVPASRARRPRRGD